MDRSAAAPLRAVQKTALSYDRGHLLVRGTFRPPGSDWDPALRAYRVPAFAYSRVVAALRCEEADFDDAVWEDVPGSISPVSLPLRDYQSKALESWARAGRRGIVVLPTGSGKTFVGLQAVADLRVPVLVCVPTLDLVEQWRDEIRKVLGVEAGAFTGERKDIRAVTVATYDSAAINAETLGNRFPFLLFDEVHHLAAPAYGRIAEMAAAPCRLGLTATLEREDGAHARLEKLVGPKVMEVPIANLAGTHLAEYDVRVVTTQLTPGEEAEYRRNHLIFRSFVRAANIKFRGPRDFQRLIMRSGRDPRARTALLARHRARTIALNSASKMAALREVLQAHPGERTLIFTEFNDLVYRISREFLVPAVTHKTPKEERARNLEGFRAGTYSALVTSRVLDEGIDVPEASVGVILSGTGSTRAYRQRLGRILRKREGKRALLYEIVSKKTSEVGTMRRRHTPVSVKLARGRGRRAAA
ncbi:MAG: DEAD/DEAH box helicase family protein [Halobacteria archaeon]